MKCRLNAMPQSRRANPKAAPATMYIFVVLICNAKTAPLAFSCTFTGESPQLLTLDDRPTLGDDAPFTAL